MLSSGERNVIFRKIYIEYLYKVVVGAEKWDQQQTIIGQVYLKEALYYFLL
jgi:hypothetical protein